MKHPTLNRLLLNLKQLRQAHGLTQEEFAERSGFSYKYYQAVETGRKKELRLSTVERLAEAYQLETCQLLSAKLEIIGIKPAKKNKKIRRVVESSAKSRRT